MVDYTDASNIKLADKLNESIDSEYKNRAYFAIAYSIFITVKKNVEDKSIINRLNPTFISIANKSISAINELAVVDMPVIKDILYKFADFENTKVGDNYLNINSIYGLFKIEEVFGVNLLENIDKDLDAFRNITSLCLVSKLFDTDLKAIMLGE